MPRLAEYDIWLLQKQFPGLPLRENVVALLWIKAHQNDYDKIDFNVRLGAGRVLPPGMDPAIVRLNDNVSRVRADMIATDGNVVDIVEFKDIAVLGAQGQLFGYRTLWQIDHPDIPVRNIVVAAFECPPDITTAFRSNGVAIELYARPA